jgi:hypothetical protein
LSEIAPSSLFAQTIDQLTMHRDERAAPGTQTTEMRQRR